MKPTVGYSVPFFVLIINIGTLRSQSSNNKKSNNYHYNGGNDGNTNYNYNYNGYNSNYQQYNYEGAQEYTYDTQPEPEPLQCYSCHYHVQKGHIQGMENCNDPFNMYGVPTVPCNGPCGKVYHQISEKEFMVIRNCMPNCKEITSESGYTACCDDDLCNGGTASTEKAHVALLALCALVTFFNSQR